MNKESWCEANRKYATAGEMPPKHRMSAPAFRYNDEVDWAYVYIHSHDVPTTGPLVRVVGRFVAALPTESLADSIEYMAFIERVATDGLTSTPLTTVHYIRDAAALFAWVCLVSRTPTKPTIVNFARTMCETHPLNSATDVSAVIAVYTSCINKVPSPLHRVLVKLKTEEENEVGFARWTSAYDALLYLVQTHRDAVVLSNFATDNVMLYYRLMYAAAHTLGDPHPWLKAACSVVRAGPLPRPTRHVETAIKRVWISRISFLNYEYVNRIRASVRECVNGVAKDMVEPWW